MGAPSRAVWSGSVALCWAWASAGQTDPASVAEVIEALRASGAEVLYSSDLVTPDLRVIAPLLGGDPLQRARQALAQHGLTLQRAASGRYLVTRAAPSSAGAATPSPPSESAGSTRIEEVSVYASRYAVLRPSAEEPHVLSSDQLEQVPGSQNDALRAARALPGIASNISSRPYIRGSSSDDVLVQFDGVPLADPFHFKNFQSLISAFDASAVDRIVVYSGGFPVRYGTRSGGVIDLAPRRLTSGYENSIGAGLIAYDLSSTGRSDHWPIEWLATARHSVNDIALKPVNGDIGGPSFSDSVGRLRLRSSDCSSWTLGWLLLDDQIQLATDPVRELAAARYRDRYAWLAYDHDFGRRLNSRTVLVATRAERARNGDLTVRGVAMGQLTEARSFDSLEVRSEWTYQPAPHLTWSYGLEAARARAELNYNRSGRFSDLIAEGFARPADNTLVASATPQVSTYALYGSVQRRWSSIAAELGLRLDGQDYHGFTAGQQWSPRLNARYDVAPRWAVYGSWGRFTQAQRLEAWRLEEVQAAPDAPELAVHAILGVTYERSEASRWRLEVYRKRWTQVSPHFENTLDALPLLPDLHPDRVRIAPKDSETDGVELSARRALSSSLETWASYAWTRVADEFASADVPRSWDQPHALTAGLVWSGERTGASAMASWHRGWPRTPFDAVPATPTAPVRVMVGSRNSARWGNYFTLDLRATWSIPLARGDLTSWTEVTNSSNRQNDCCVGLGSAASGMPVTESSAWLPRIFNAGITWRFHNVR